MDAHPPAGSVGVAPALLAVVREWLAPDAAVVAPARAVAARLRQMGHRTHPGPLSEVDAGVADVVLLLDDELSRAVATAGRGAPGDHAEELLAEVGRVLRPGGVLVATARNRVHAAATGNGLDGLRGYSAEELSRLLGQRGFRRELLCAPGAAAVLAASVGGASKAPFDPRLDRQPGLLDVGPRLLAVARAPHDDASRSTAFFASLPRKVVAAAVICRDEIGRMLVVHDSFKQHWTIPGGVVDADENPADGAAREAWEEAGIRVTIGALLGVFAAAWPDRVVLVYAAEAREAVDHPTPVHAHEIDAVEWVGVEVALERLAPHVAEQVRCCLESPGGTWTLGRA